MLPLCDLPGSLVDLVSHIMAIVKNVFVLSLLVVATLTAQLPSKITYTNTRRLLFDTDGNQIDA